MGTRPKDWDMIAECYESCPDIVQPCFGYHPWLIYEQHISQTNWKEKLELLLLKYPKSIIGEFGLDKIATTPQDAISKHSSLPKSTYDGLQKESFSFQFQLAVKLKRPISLHSVQAYGYIHDYLKQQCDKVSSRGFIKKHELESPENIVYPDAMFPPAIMLHSFSGSPGMLQQLIKLPHVGNRLYFSFSKVINLRYKNIEEIILSVPNDRLLLESDISDIEAIPQCLIDIAELIAKAKGWSLDEVEEKINENASRFFNV
ncbi:hypothetical protein MP638_005663 [Amoeboaphelidium occidentale]|nr:hypothetical protein MP638_005663 [Amoeboaphelidium occidentale]